MLKLYENTKLALLFITYFILISYVSRGFPDALLANELCLRPPLMSSDEEFLTRFEIRYNNNIDRKKFLKISLATVAGIVSGSKIVGAVEKSASYIEALFPEVDNSIDNNMADRGFWEWQFKNYPDDKPVSGLITFERIHRLWETKQSDNLFNGLRTYPSLLYRYLAEIPEDRHHVFSRYFAALKPGTRQQVFSIFYERLRKDLSILEEQGSIRGLFKKIDYEKLAIQTDLLTHLYGTMSQMLNRTKPLDVGELPERVVAPFPIMGMTKAQTIRNIQIVFKEVIQDFVNKGYTVTLPSPKEVNVSKITALIGYHTYNNPLGSHHVFFYQENHSAELLQWIMQETDLSNPLGHRINDRELLEQAMLLCSEGTEVNLFKAIATIGHYYKTMARRPGLILGGPEARGLEDGTDFIRGHHDHMSLCWALNPDVKPEEVKIRRKDNTSFVDENGQPVIFWKGVNKDGNDFVPNGQRVGIFWYSTEDDFYHAWNFVLTALYVAIKSREQLIEDVDAAVGPRDAMPADIIRMPGNMTEEEFNRLEKSTIKMFLEGGIAPNDTLYTLYLPVFYKDAKRWRLEERAIKGITFGTRQLVESEERSKIVFAKVGEWVQQELIKNRFIHFTEQSELLVRSSDGIPARVITGGRDVDSYKRKIMATKEKLIKLSDEELSNAGDNEFFKFLMGALQIEDLTSERDSVDWFFDHDLSSKNFKQQGVYYLLTRIAMYFRDEQIKKLIGRYEDALMNRALKNYIPNLDLELLQPPLQRAPVGVTNEIIPMNDAEIADEQILVEKIFVRVKQNFPEAEGYRIELVPGLVRTAEIDTQEKIIRVKQGVSRFRDNLIHLEVVDMPHELGHEKLNLGDKTVEELVLNVQDLKRIAEYIKQNPEQEGAAKLLSFPMAVIYVAAKPDLELTDTELIRYLIDVSDEYLLNALIMYYKQWDAQFSSGITLGVVDNALLELENLSHGLFKGIYKYPKEIPTSL